MKIYTFLEEVFPVDVPRDVTKIIATYLQTHIHKAFLVDDVAEWRKRNMKVLHWKRIDRNTSMVWSE